VLTLNKYSKMYDYVYIIADYLWKLYNPCQIKNGMCRYNNAWHREKHQTTCCGNDCKHLSKNGCTIKSLGCKLYWCNGIEKHHKEFVNIIDLLVQAIDYGSVFNLRSFSYCYQSKEEFMTRIKREIKYREENE